MTQIKDERVYKATMERIEELLPIVTEETPTYDKNLIELELLSNLAADYEDENYPIERPTLSEVIKLRMYEMQLTQAKLSKMLGVSPSRISELLSGKTEPTLKIARELCLKLNIDPYTVLGI